MFIIILVIKTHLNDRFNNKDKSESLYCVSRQTPLVFPMNKKNKEVINMPTITIIGEVQCLEPDRVICLICGETVDEKPIERDKAVCISCEENVFERPSNRWIDNIKSKIESEEYEERWKRKLGLERTPEPRPRMGRKFEKGW